MSGPSANRLTTASAPYWSERRVVDDGYRLMADRELISLPTTQGEWLSSKLHNLDITTEGGKSMESPDKHGRQDSGVELEEQQAHKFRGAYDDAFNKSQKPHDQGPGYGPRKPKAHVYFRPDDKLESVGAAVPVQQRARTPYQGHSSISTAKVITREEYLAKVREGELQLERTARLHYRQIKEQQAVAKLQEKDLTLRLGLRNAVETVTKVTSKVHGLFEAKLYSSNLKRKLGVSVKRPGRGGPRSIRGISSPMMHTHPSRTSLLTRPIVQRPKRSSPSPARHRVVVERQGDAEAEHKDTAAPSTPLCELPGTDMDGNMQRMSGGWSNEGGTNRGFVFWEEEDERNL